MAQIHQQTNDLQEHIISNVRRVTYGATILYTILYMSILQDCRIINLNSKDCIRNNGINLSNVSFAISNLIKDDKNMLYSTIGIINCQIPVSWYLINSTNCNLNVSISGTSYTIILTKGNYNSSTLFQELKSKFLQIGINLTISINKITGVLTFDFNGVVVSLLTSVGIFRILGFDDITYTGTIIIPPFPLNLLGVKKLKINSAYLATNSYDSANSFAGDTIHTIPVDVPAFGLITFLNQSSTYGKMRLRRIDTIDIQILDEYNQFIEFNNIDWSMTLQLVIYRKYEKDVDDLIVKPLNTTLEKIDKDLVSLSGKDDKKEPENLPENKLPEIMGNPDNDLDLLLYENHGVI